MIALLLNEFAKHVRSKLAWLGLVAVGLASFLWPQGIVIAGASPDFSAFVFLKTVAATSFELIIPFFASLFAAGLVATETQLGTDRMVLCGPVRRGSWLAAKLALALGYVGALIAVHVATACLAARGHFPFKGYEEFGEVVVSARATAGYYAAAYAWLALPMAAAACYGFFVSTVSRGAGAAMGVTAGLFATLLFLRVAGFDLGRWFFMNHIGAPLKMAEEASAAISTSLAPSGVVEMAVVSLATVLLFAGASFLLYARRDLHD
jgi:hypothetical protein